MANPTPLGKGMVMKIDEEKGLVYIVGDLADTNFAPSKKAIESNGKEGTMRITAGAPAPFIFKGKTYKVNCSIFTYDLPFNLD